MFITTIINYICYCYFGYVLKDTVLPASTTTLRYYIATALITKNIQIMNDLFIHFLREARLFMHTPRVVHLGIMQLLLRLWNAAR